MALNMQVIMGQLAQSCYPNEQSRANGFAQALQVLFPLAASTFNYGISTPNVDQQSLPWYRLNSDGTPDNWYVYINGFWIRPHTVPAGSPISYFFEGSLSNLATYDGGEGNYVTNADGTITPTIAISATTGPMWQVDTNLQGRFPLGVSNTSVAAQQKDAYGNIINNFVQGGSGGEIQHTLTVKELAPHTHAAYSAGAGAVYLGTSGQASTLTGITGGDTINNVNNVPVGHNVLNPYYVGYWIQRSSRAYYRL